MFLACIVQNMVEHMQAQWKSVLEQYYSFDSDRGPGSAEEYGRNLSEAYGLTPDAAAEFLASEAYGDIESYGSEFRSQQKVAAMPVSWQPLVATYVQDYAYAKVEDIQTIVDQLDAAGCTPAQASQYVASSVTYKDACNSRARLNIKDIAELVESKVSAPTFAQMLQKVGAAKSKIEFLAIPQVLRVFAQDPSLFDKYLACGGSSINNVAAILAYKEKGITPDELAQWVSLGVRDSRAVLALHKRGFEPSDIPVFLRSYAQKKQGWQPVLDRDAEFYYSCGLMSKEDIDRLRSNGVQEYSENGWPLSLPQDGPQWNPRTQCYNMPRAGARQVYTSPPAKQKNDKGQGIEL